jgi:hypothetical protein
MDIDRCTTDEDDPRSAAVISGAVIPLPVVITMIRHEDSAWQRAAAEPLRPGDK